MRRRRVLAGVLIACVAVIGWSIPAAGKVVKNCKLLKRSEINRTLDIEVGKGRFNKRAQYCEWEKGGVDVHLSVFTGFDGTPKVGIDAGEESVPDLDNAAYDRELNTVTLGVGDALLALTYLDYSGDEAPDTKNELVELLQLVIDRL